MHHRPAPVDNGALAATALLALVVPALVLALSYPAVTALVAAFGAGALTATRLLPTARGYTHRPLARLAGHLTRFQ